MLLELGITEYDYLLKLGFSRSINEPTLYVKQSGSDLIVISLYVDDFLVTATTLLLWRILKVKCRKFFEITDMGKISYFLGMKIL